jgi:hypothetical protein
VANVTHFSRRWREGGTVCGGVCNCGALGEEEPDPGRRFRALRALRSGTKGRERASLCQTAIVRILRTARRSRYRLATCMRPQGAGAGRSFCAQARQVAPPLWRRSTALPAPAPAIPLPRLRQLRRPRGGDCGRSPNCALGTTGGCWQTTGRSRRRASRREDRDSPRRGPCDPRFRVEEQSPPLSASPRGRRSVRRDGVRRCKRLEDNKVMV